MYQCFLQQKRKGTKSTSPSSEIQYKLDSCSKPCGCIVEQNVTTLQGLLEQQRISKHLPSCFHATSYIICFTCSACLSDYASKSKHSAETCDSQTFEVDNSQSGQEVPHIQIYPAEQCHRLQSALLITAIACKLVKQASQMKMGLWKYQS